MAVQLVGQIRQLLLLLRREAACLAGVAHDRHRRVSSASLLSARTAVWIRLNAVDISARLLLMGRNSR